MTSARYAKAPMGGALHAQVVTARGGSSSSNADNPSNAWNVNFNNGNDNNDNNDNKTNNNYVRLVRSSQWTKPSGQALYAAWQAARKRKKASYNQLAFESRWIDGLDALAQALAPVSDGDGCLIWQPRRTTCFVTHRPKTREIHAPDFSDRVVHHFLVPQLEKMWEPVFIHDCHSNRRGRGTHTAVDRLQSFMRQVSSSRPAEPAGEMPTENGWYLQLDIANFFNSIHRPTLYALLKKRIAKHARHLPQTVLLQHLCHALLRRNQAQSAHIRATAQELTQVPYHKRLVNAAPQCGLAIGNLSSQFFANVYMNELDQFVKHTLKCKRYVRYVDDFVLVHESKVQLLQWQTQIEAFIATRLRLKLKVGSKCEPLRRGCDFLGYVVYPQHRTVRARVLTHCHSQLAVWASGCVTRQDTDDAGYPRFTVKASCEQLTQLRAVLASYWGHFSHANSWQLRLALWDHFPWLYGMVRPVQTATKVLCAQWHIPKRFARSTCLTSSLFTHTFSIGDTPCVH